MLPIVQAPQPVLAQPAKKIAKIDREIRTLISEMTETLLKAKDPEGVGLAAPQVGKALQLFIIKESPTDLLLIFINPKIGFPKGAKTETVDTVDAITEDMGKQKKSSGKKEVKLEGCLSLQDIWGIVNRYPKVQVTYQDETGATQTKLFGGFLATIIQHEYDHLQGILFPRRVLEQKGNLYKSVKNSKGELEFEELPI